MLEGIAALPLGQFQRPIGCDTEEEVGSVRCLQGNHIRVCKEPRGYGQRREGAGSSTRAPQPTSFCLLAAPLPPPPLPQGRWGVREATDCQAAGGD